MHHHIPNNNDLQVVALGYIQEFFLKLTYFASITGLTKKKLVYCNNVNYASQMNFVSLKQRIIFMIWMYLPCKILCYFGCRAISASLTDNFLTVLSSEQYEKLAGVFFVFVQQVTQNGPKHNFCIQQTRCSQGCCINSFVMH